MPFLDNIQNGVENFKVTLGLSKKKEPIFAIDIGSRLIKLAEIEQSSSGPKLTKFASEFLPLGAIVDGKIVEEQIVVDTIRALMKEHKFDKDKVCISANGPAIIVKNIFIPKVKSSTDLVDNIYFAAEENIPFELTEVTIDYEVVEDNTESDNTEVLLVAAKNDFMSNRRSVLEKAGLKIQIIDVDTLALANIFWHNYEMGDELVLLADVGASLTKINIVSKDRSVFIREVANGGSDITREIQESLELEFEEAEALKMEASEGGKAPPEVKKCIENGLETIFTEIGRCIDFFSTSNASNISKIYVSGGTCRVHNLEEIVGDSIDLPIEYLYPFEKIDIDSSSFSDEYIAEIANFASMPLGLALRSIE